MQKLFHFDSPVEVYRADACVLTCFDARFELAARKFLRRQGVAVYDQIKIPGAARAVAAPASDGDRDFVLRMLAASIALHGSARMILTGHADCGAYLGRPPEELIADIGRAAEVIRTAQPSLAIERYFFDFDGVYQV
ncbi:MAG: carbonic anhydrase [Bryobacteraceae bacterium]